MNTKTLACAIYTRKSTDEGLDREFNSLDAQREACVAYVKSQANEGWRVVEEQFDDGGYSGGSLERPAIKRLIDGVKAGRINVIVVYKIDRLTRSLADFARLVEILDAHDASFVSVTQQFNTTSSMGRLTLNVLLSFAQFEREVTSERIRDKVAASKRKGMWMGGYPPLGYDIVNRRLAVNKTEAAQVRRIFELALQTPSLTELERAIANEDLRAKRWQAQSGKSGIHKSDPWRRR
jgi:DNA invertase Pin-like site-specific DNA recombinase